MLILHTNTGTERQHYCLKWSRALIMRYCYDICRHIWPYFLFTQSLWKNVFGSFRIAVQVSHVFISDLRK